MAKNPFTRLGRPPKSAFGSVRPRKAKAVGVASGFAAAPGSAPTDGMDFAVPGSAFRHGGAVNGHRCMPQHHDDARLCRGGKP